MSDALNGTLAQGRGRDSRIYAEPCPERIEHRHELRNWSAVSLLSPTQDHINDLRPPGGAL